MSPDRLGTAYASICRSDHVGLGSDFDGAVTVPIDATGMVQITEALLEVGMDEVAVAKVMGGNALRVLAEVLPS
jgi:microsomal dipeptidase-like Zn-dependent dipeptidase